MFPCLLLLSLVSLRVRVLQRLFFRQKASLKRGMKNGRFGILSYNEWVKERLMICSSYPVRADARYEMMLLPLFDLLVCVCYVITARKRQVYLLSQSSMSTLSLAGMDKDVCVCVCVISSAQPSSCLFWSVFIFLRQFWNITWRSTGMLWVLRRLLYLQSELGLDILFHTLSAARLFIAGGVVISPKRTSSLLNLVPLEGFFFFLAATEGTLTLHPDFRQLCLVTKCQYDDNSNNFLKGKFHSCYS